MARIGGMFNGTGADLVICCGFEPDYVHLFNFEATSPVEIVWNKHMMRSATMTEGFIYTWNATFGSSDAEELAIGAGVAPYAGGLTLNSTTAGTTTYGEGSYLKPDFHDYRRVNNTDTGVVGDAISNDIDTWTLDTTATYKGHFNADVTGTYIGEGSPICIDGRWYCITALTASQGISTDEVTVSMGPVINLGPPSGKITFIGGMYDYKPMVAGEVTKAGFLIGNATLNANGNKVGFEAGTYDM